MSVCAFNKKSKKPIKMSSRNIICDILLAEVQIFISKDFIVYLDSLSMNELQIERRRVILNEIIDESICVNQKYSELYKCLIETSGNQS